MDVIEEEAQRSTFVICDLEGTASLTVSYAVSRSDLVLIPLQGSHLDAAQASNLGAAKDNIADFAKAVTARLRQTAVAAQ
jgi:chromosome partitioning protein